MTTRAELKSLAKEQIRGNIGIIFLCYLVFGLITAVLCLPSILQSIKTMTQLMALMTSGTLPQTMPQTMSPINSLCSIAILLISPAFALSFAMIFLALTKGIKPKVVDVFEGFKNWLKAFLLGLLMGIFVMLWSMLLFVPGIIKALSYSMSYYILAENPDMTAREALNESKKIMKGNKWRLFVLYLSFILWALLGTVTCGIAYIYVYPYMYATIANFYNAIKQIPESTQMETAEVPA